MSQYATWLDGIVSGLVTLPVRDADDVVAQMCLLDEDRAAIRTALSRARQEAALASWATPTPRPRKRHGGDPDDVAHVSPAWEVAANVDESPTAAIDYGLGRLAHDQDRELHRERYGHIDPRFRRYLIDEQARTWLTAGWDVAAHNVCSRCHTARSANGACLC